MAEVAKAYVTVMPSAKGFSKALGNEIDGTFVAAGRRGGDTIGDEAGRSGGKSFAAAGAKLAGAFAAAFVAVGAVQVVKGVSAYLADAIGSASDLEQSVGGVDAVFKDSAGQIHTWAKGAATGAGLARSEYNELATVIGAQLKNMGVPLDEVADKTDWLITKGSDLAAQFGGSTSDAVSALSSLLRGERDPIERYGVSINDARIQAELAEQGLGDLDGEAKKVAETQATLKLLTEQTADATGAFARESETLAGQQQRVQAEMENIKTEIGEALLPVMSDLLGVFRDEGVPALQELAGWFTENKDAIYDLAVGAAESGLAFIDALLAMGEAGAEFNLSTIEMLRNIVNGFFIMAGGIVNAAQIAYGWIPGVGDKLDGLEGDLTAAQGVANTVFDTMGEDARTARDAFGEGRDMVGSLRDAISTLDGKRATVYFNAQGNALELFQRAPGLTPDIIPGRATGGPVTAGRPYIVGEREAELFVPSQSGVILNQRQIAAAGGGAGSPTINMDIHTSPGLSERAIGDAAARQLVWKLSEVPR